MVRICLGPGVSLLPSPDPHPCQGLLEVCVLWAWCLAPELGQHPQRGEGAAAGTEPCPCTAATGEAPELSQDQLWQAESAASAPFHKYLIQALVSSLLNAAAVQSFPGWELLQDVCYQWPLCSLLRLHFYFPSHSAAGGRC